MRGWLAQGGAGGLRPAIENCCPYPERSVYTTCKVKQIDPGCRFTCVFVWLPVNLPACHLQSLFAVPDQTSLSLSLYVCVCVQLCLCVCISVFVCWCVYICMPLCAFPHVGARPGSREALGETSGWHGALSETGHRLIDTMLTRLLHVHIQVKFLIQIQNLISHFL